MLRKRWPFILVVVLLAAWLATGVREVRPGQRAVVRRFGRVLDVRPVAGLWVGLPWGIDRVDTVAVEQERQVTVGYQPLSSAEETPAGQLQTGDRNLVNVRVVVTYTVDPERVVEYVEQGDAVEPLLARAAETALAEWLAGRTVDAVLLEDRPKLPGALVERLSPRVAELGLGVWVRRVIVDHLGPPEEVRADFDRAARAGADSKRVVEEANSRAETRRDSVEAEVAQMNREGDAYATRRVVQAEAEAAAFGARVAVYRKYPLVREAGAWAHLRQLLERLGKDNQITPVDEALTNPLMPRR